MATLEIEKDETLCDVCTEAIPYIKRLLHPDLDSSDPNTPQFAPLGLVKEIQATKDKCTLCKLTDHALTQSWPQVPVWSKPRTGMFAPMVDTRAALVAASPVNEFWSNELPKDVPRCLHVEIVLDGVRPMREDVGPSGGLTQARDMAGFKIGGHERLFQPEIRLLRESIKGKGQEGSDLGLAREIGQVCSSDRLRGWYRGCVGDPAHDENCATVRIVSDDDFEVAKGQPPPPAKLPEGARLIDVEAMKLVPAEQKHDTEFLALSYVWGNKKIPDLETKKSNVKARLKNGGLKQVSLPKTISDAIELTKDLGVRYLWVDTLCIVQDAGKEKTIQIEAMDKIYGMASLVIIAAAGGDSEAGLVGFRTSPREPATRDAESKEKDHGQLTAQIQDLGLAVSPPPLQHILATSKWNTRAWTYQEWRFARRALIFPPTQVYFLCSAISFSEDVILESGKAASLVYQMISQRGPAAIDRHTVPGMEHHRKALTVSSGWIAYTDAVQSFSPRLVKDPRDILLALAGILGNMHRATRNRFVAGLSVGLMHDALLWVPVVGHLERQRGKRVDMAVTATKDPNGWRTGGNWLPTWSWAEWDGAVEYGAIPPGDSLVKEFRVVFTEPHMGGNYKPPSDPEQAEQVKQSEDDGAAVEKRKSKRLSRFFQLFKKSPPETPDGDENADWAAKRSIHATILGHPLSEPQTDRPIPGIIYFGSRPRLYGDDPEDGVEEEAKRVGRPVGVDQAQSYVRVGSSNRQNSQSIGLLPPVYSYRCALSFTATTAKLQVAPIMDDHMGRADGLLDLDGRYVGVALLDKPGVPMERLLRGFYKVDVIALSVSHLPTVHVLQGAFSTLAGVVEGEAPEWIGLLIGSELRASRTDDQDTPEGERAMRTFVRIGVAQVVKKAWDTWVEKKEEEVALR